MNGTWAAENWVVTGALIMALSSSGCGAGPEIREAVVEQEPLIELRLVRDDEGPGLTSNELDGETLYLEANAVLSDQDFEGVRTTIRSDQLYLELQLTGEARERLMAVTADEIGTRLAILIESEVRSAPTIRDVIDNARSTMVIPASEEEARRLAALIDARWRGSP